LVTLAVGVILIKRKGTFAAGAQGNALKVITFLGSLLIAYVVLIFYYIPRFHSLAKKWLAGAWERDSS